MFLKIPEDLSEGFYTGESYASITSSVLYEDELITLPSLTGPKPQPVLSYPPFDPNNVKEIDGGLYKIKIAHKGRIGYDHLPVARLSDVYLRAAEKGYEIIGEPKKLF